MSEIYLSCVIQQENQARGLNFRCNRYYDGTTPGDPTKMRSSLMGVRVVSAARVSGGDLSNVLRLSLADGRSIIAKRGPLVEEEAIMLAAIHATQAPVPSVLAVEKGLMLLEDLPGSGQIARSWAQLAEVLDHLHRPTRQQSGWDRDHGFGPVAIPNGRTDNWVEFWAERRLCCHLPHIEPHLADRVSRLADRLADHIPTGPQVALLHGDLWGGNILIEKDRVSGLIDPACYFGDREVDLAMLSLFDQPPAAFYDACGLEQGWQERQPVYRLWPLLVHVRLFGGAYHQQASACLDMLGL
ncbi:fructosamine kinase family protein [Sphingobium yanoikuyae]|uniref:fructosamine kinase family protein n=1 Tax=Sphingobium yanoikuyae TaxID=13690 RepID=UPI0028A79791|nr:fructosamine kinase family protein [Sphingobium yanoikuyae]